MFDFHMHSKLSFDSEEEPLNMVRAAEQTGLKEICFTDHYDQHGNPNEEHDIFTIDEYKQNYKLVTSDIVKIRKGVEMGLTLWNVQHADDFIKKAGFDFVIGSAHYAGDSDPYFAEYWEGLTYEEAIEKHLLHTLECVRIHDNFDVLGHLTYVCKSEHNPTRKAVAYADVADIADEIMKCLVSKGKGMEINTSGMNSIGEFLPSADYLRRFHELGGEIVTIGSDAHNSARVGQYSNEAIAIVQDIFGYVCTFSHREPIFHKVK